MKLHTMPQGSPEWHAIRAGVITASNFALARERTAKGVMTAAAKSYAFRVALERIAGAPLEEPQFVPWQARRGQIFEPVAARLYELQTGASITPVGFVTSDCGSFGASPDGLVADDAGVEFKAFLNADKIREIILTGDIGSCIDQVQGGMWLTGRSRWTFGLLCPALAPIGRALTLHEIERDDAQIEQMAAELEQFDAHVETIVASLREQIGPDQRELIASLMPDLPDRSVGAGIDPDSIVLF